ncbi:hypothetical protein HK098_002463 [Nowakowskiella sp. JEL0407]|nr:hypothetical protein HK098_002463 [Nowakowskiella sp. JEL0407]
MFDSIVIDWSTWRYMNPLKPGVLSEWKRILKVGGTFVFECGVSSMKYTHGEELIYLGIDLTDSRQIMKLLRFDFDNLTHLVVPIEIAKVLIERACNEILTSGWNEEHGNSVSQTQVGSNIVKNDKRSPIDRLRGASSHEVKKSGVNLDTTPRILPAAKSAVCCCANSVVEIFAELRLSEFRRKILERKIISPQDVSSEFESNECDMIVAYYLNEILELKYHDMFCGVEGENFFTKMTVYCSGGQLTSDFVKETELKYPIKTKGEIKRWIELIK